MRSAADVGLSCFLGRLGDGKAPLVQTAEEKAASALRASADAPPPPPPARSNDEMTNLERILHNSGLPCETQTEIATGKSIDYP